MPDNSLTSQRPVIEVATGTIITLVPHFNMDTVGHRGDAGRHGDGEASRGRRYGPGRRAT